MLEDTQILRPGLGDLLGALDRGAGPEAERAIDEVDRLLQAEAVAGRAWHARWRKARAEGATHPPPPADDAWRLVIETTGGIRPEASTSRPSPQNIANALRELLVRRFRGLLRYVVRSTGAPVARGDEGHELAHELILALDAWRPPEGDPAAIPVSVAFPRHLATRLWDTYALVPRAGRTRRRVDWDGVVLYGDVSSDTPGPEQVETESEEAARAARLLARIEASCSPRHRAIMKLVLMGRAPDRAVVDERLFGRMVQSDLERFRLFTTDELADLLGIVRRNRPWGNRRLPRVVVDAAWLAVGARVVLVRERPDTCRRHVQRLLGLDESSVSEAVVAFRNAARAVGRAEAQGPEGAARSEDGDLRARVEWLLEVPHDS